ncbi:13841_t:CDS:1 [Funneliformis mosseae]|uniref:13841_t:CDS:1 n=1 Tax=Funneliformis mosseae TaxID=27381 RepID=A0A9N9GT07_FUNMO|nr:13841_t:CDS:1 [Funneliformis mosseae]
MSLFKVTEGLTLFLLYTDADPMMIVVINSTWLTTKHHFCLFYIRKNLEKHFLSKYHSEKWNKFFAAFCYARNSRVESIFEGKWAALLQEYPDAISYLQRYLYLYREAWVLCFTYHVFNARIQSTQRVESYNSIIKNNVNGLSSLTELKHTIERLLAKESKFIKLNETIGKLPVSQDEDYYNHYFKEVDISCQYFLILAILKLQRHEMNRSMHYRCHLSNLEYELK